MSTPTSDATPSGMPVMICSRMAPVAANGTETSSSSGCSSDRNVATMTTYTMRIAASSASPSCENDSCWSAVTPPMDADVPAGRSTAASACCTCPLAVPRSSPAGVAATVALRRPLTVVTDAGPSTCATVASVSRRTGPAGVGTGRACSSATDAGGVSPAR